MSALEPGFSPTTTYDVFFDTDPVTFPPAACTRSVAWSRLRVGRVPVITNVKPSSGRSPCSTTCSARLTPAARHFSTISPCQSTENHSLIESAMIPPTPSTAARLSAGASAMTSSDRNSRASDCAAVGPT
ncbi:unannotated protein [freshwater metagenome]|uniref:Unannotated protein n=1 Tax=freshwater metagenome TaxID=449393 RepID=A0A6J7IUK7_9ZZZZ